MIKNDLQYQPFQELVKMAEEIERKDDFLQIRLKHLHLNKEDAEPCMEEVFKLQSLYQKYIIQNTFLLRSKGAVYEEWFKNAPTKVKWLMKFQPDALEEKVYQMMFQSFLEGKVKINESDKTRLINMSVALRYELSPMEIKQKLLDELDQLPNTKKEFNFKDLDQFMAVLNRQIIGQELAVKKVSEAMQIAFAELADPKRPLACFLFAGPTGVGKTEMGKAIAEGVKPFGYDFVRINLENLKNSGEGVAIFGPQVGYHHAEKGGELTNALKKNHKLVVLFDECEKADPGILDNLLSLIDEGYVKDPLSHKELNARKTVIIFTTNVGSHGLPSFSSTKIPSNYFKTLESRIRGHFKSEFISRLELVVFEPILSSNIQKIVEQNLTVVAKELKERGIELKWNDEIVDYFAKKLIKGDVRQLKANLRREVMLIAAKMRLQNRNLSELNLIVNKREKTLNRL